MLADKRNVEEKAIDNKLKFVMECIYDAAKKGQTECEVHGLAISEEMQARLKELGYHVVDGFSGYIRLRYKKITWGNNAG